MPRNAKRDSRNIGRVSQDRGADKIATTVSSKAEVDLVALSNTGLPQPAFDEPESGVVARKGTGKPYAKDRYPLENVACMQLRNGARVQIRPIKPADELALRQFHRGLSDRTVYLRYFSHLKLKQRVSHQRLSKVCHSDYATELVLIAEVRTLHSVPPKIIGVARLNVLTDMESAEVAVVVADAFHGKRLGSTMLQMLAQVARQRKIRNLVAITLCENRAFQHIFEKLGFDIQRDVNQGELQITLKLE